MNHRSKKMTFKRIFLFSVIISVCSIAKANDFKKNTFSNNQQTILLNQSHMISNRPVNLNLINVSLSASEYKHPLEKVGKVLTIVGLPILILGTTMTIIGDEYHYTCDNYGCSGDPVGAIGVTLLPVGAGLTGAGIPLWIIGRNKRK